MEFKKYNRAEVEEHVEAYITQLEAEKAHWGWYNKLRIKDVCDELSIFDWWNDYLSLSQLEQMQKFLKVAGDLGYDGYVCFKVGAAGCSHGMWAHKEESTDGYSPDGECLFHSFRSGDNYYDAKLADGEWMHEKYEDCYEFSLKEVKAELRK